MATTKNARGSRVGLRLTLGGAPDTPHILPGVPGMYRPGAPTLVGGDGEMTVDEAKRLDHDQSIPLELVDVTDPADGDWVEQARALSRGAIRSAVAESRRDGNPDMELDRITDEADAVGKED